MSMTLVKVEIETNAGGTGVGVISGVPAGIVHQVRYVIDATDNYVAGATLAIAEYTTGYKILDIADFTTAGVSLNLCTRQPRVDSTDGSAGTVLDTIAVVNDITITVTDGGNTKKGMFYVYINS